MRFPKFDSWKLLIASAVVALAFIGPANADGGTVGYVRAWQFSCTSTAKQFSTSVPILSLASANSFKFKNGSGATVYVGGSDVNTTTKGMEYVASDSDSYDATPQSMWCVSAGTSTITVLAGKF